MGRGAPREAAPSSDGSSQRAAGRGRPSHPPALAVHLLSLALGVVALVVISRDQWFIADEWDFLADRPLDDLRALFIPHNEHWSTLPIVVYRLLYAAVGLHSYLPYLLVGFLVHVAIAHLLWRLQRRAGADAWIATATSAAFVVFGAGSENLLTAFGLTFDTSVLAGLGQILLVDHDDDFNRRDALGLGLALAGLLSSGVAITMVAVAGLTALLRRGWRAALLTVGPPAVIYVVWLAVIGHLGLGTHGGSVEVFSIPAFVWRGVTKTVDISVGLPGAGAVTVAGLSLWVLRHRGELRRRAAAPTACAVGTVAFFLLAGAGRAGMATAQASSSRYLYVAAVLLIPLVGVALSDLARRPRLARAGVLLLLAVVAANGWRLLAFRARVEADAEQRLRRIILAASRLDVLPSELLALVPEPRFNPNLGYPELVTMRREGKLPTYDDVTRADELSALTHLQITVSPEPRLPLRTRGTEAEPGATVTVATGVDLAWTGPGCLRAQPTSPAAQLLLAVPAPASLWVSAGTGPPGPGPTGPSATGPPGPGPMGPSRAGDIALFLRDEDGTTAGMPQLAPLGPSPIYLNLNLTARTVLVGLPEDRATTICGLEPPSSRFAGSSSRPPGPYLSE
ncbi:MAG: hypothetical protein M3133_00085 [Actinomycetota bacterium]|nr:hypothetical protein [Actinomycetota bacterium]